MIEGIAMGVPNIYVKLLDREGYFQAKIIGKNNTIAIWDSKENLGRFKVLIDSDIGFAIYKVFEVWDEAVEFGFECLKMTGDFDYKPVYPPYDEHEHKHNHMEVS